MPLWSAAKPLVLASASRVRRTLLAAAGVPVEVWPSELDERKIEAGAAFLDATAVAGLLAREKALLVAQCQPGRLVLGADQVLAFDGRRFTKPPDRAAAHIQLHALCGRSHELHSAIAFVQDATVLFEHVGSARLTMRPFSDRFLDLYLDAVGAAASKASAPIRSRVLVSSYSSGWRAIILPSWVYRCWKHWTSCGVTDGCCHEFLQKQTRRVLVSVPSCSA